MVFNLSLGFLGPGVSGHGFPVFEKKENLSRNILMLSLSILWGSPFMPCSAWCCLKQPPGTDTHLPVRCFQMSLSWLNPPCRVCFTGICALHSPDGMATDRGVPHRADFIASALPDLRFYLYEDAAPLIQYSVFIFIC